MPTTPATTPVDEQVSSLLRGLPILSAVDDEGLRDRLAQLERIANMAQAAQASVMSELAGRASESEYEFVADEIAITLCSTKAEASNRFALALDIVEHSAVMTAWRAGRLSARKSRVICDGLRGASPIAIDALADGAVTYAESHTAPELRRWLGRRVLAADPRVVEQQRRLALADRRVMLTPLSNGLAEFSALLPAVQARQIYETVNAVASAPDAHDVRTMDQRRSDAFVDLVLGRAEPPRVSLNLTMPVSAIEGRSAGPAMLSGVGPLPTSEVQHLVSGATLRRMLTDPTSGYLVDVSEKRYRPTAALDRAVRLRDQVCRFPGCSRPSTTKQSGTDLDHTTPWPEGETAAANLAVLCRHHHRLKHVPGWSAKLSPDGVMTWTTPVGKTFVTQPWVYSDPG